MLNQAINVLPDLDEVDDDDDADSRDDDEDDLVDKDEIKDVDEATGGLVDEYGVSVDSDRG